MSLLTLKRNTFYHFTGRPQRLLRLGEYDGIIEFTEICPLKSPKARRNPRKTCIGRVLKFRIFRHVMVLPAGFCRDFQAHIGLHSFKSRWLKVFPNQAGRNGKQNPWKKVSNVAFWPKFKSHLAEISLLNLSISWGFLRGLLLAISSLLISWFLISKSTHQNESDGAKNHTKV